MDLENTHLEKRLQEKIDSGHDLLASINSSIKGSDKLGHKINAEIKFLYKIKKCGMVKEDHLRSSNLLHLSALCHCCVMSQQVVAILEPFSDANGDRVVVDIIRKGGAEWVKVIARNPQALQLISEGAGTPGQKSVEEQATKLLSCASCSPFMFAPPKVVIHFASGVTKSLEKILYDLGVLVEGERIEKERSVINDPFENAEELAAIIIDNDAKHEDADSSSIMEQESVMDQALSDISHLNLDVSTMIAYVSALTSGRCHSRFLEPILEQQAAWERQTPVKPFLEQLFHGKKLHCCQMAHQDFQCIVDTVGGPEEKRRAEELSRRITVISDDPSSRALTLIVGGRVKQRAQVVFGTGDTRRMITVTANQGFIRAARAQGVTFAVVVHGSRALTEAKEVPHFKIGSIAGDPMLVQTHIAS